MELVSFCKWNKVHFAQRRLPACAVRAEASRLKTPCSSLTPSPLVGGISSPEPSAKGTGAAERRPSVFTEMGQRSLPCNTKLVMLKMLPVLGPFAARAQKPSPSSGHSFIAMLPILILM